MKVYIDAVCFGLFYKDVTRVRRCKNTPFAPTELLRIFTRILFSKVIYDLCEMWDANLIIRAQLLLNFNWLANEQAMRNFAGYKLHTFSSLSEELIVILLNSARYRFWRSLFPTAVGRSGNRTLRRRIAIAGTSSRFVTKLTRAFPSSFRPSKLGKNEHANCRTAAIKRRSFFRRMVPFVWKRVYLAAVSPGPGTRSSSSRFIIPWNARGHPPFNPWAL